MYPFNVPSFTNKSLLYWPKDIIHNLMNNVRYYSNYVSFTAITYQPHVQNTFQFFPAVIIMRIVELSLEHGLNPLSPLGFALYGSFLASMGDISTGYRFALLSRKLLEKIGSNQSRGEGESDAGGPLFYHYRWHIIVP